MRDILKLGIILMVYSVIAGAALAYVNILTKPKVAMNLVQTAEKTRAEVLPGMSGFDEKTDASGFTYWIGYTDAAKTQAGGYVFLGQKKGYSSVIQAMVGVGLDGKIIGVKVLSQQETPGLGTKIMEVRHGENAPWFPAQYLGKSVADPLKVKKDGGEIDAITGATISSRAMTKAIRDGLEMLQKARGGEGA